MSILVDSPAHGDRQRHHPAQVAPGLNAPACATTLRNVAAARRGNGVGASCALAAVPNLCAHGGQWASTTTRAPAAVVEYLDSLGGFAFDLRAACARWAGMFSQRHQSRRRFCLLQSQQVPARLIVFPAEGNTQRSARRLAQTDRVRPPPRAQAQFHGGRILTHTPTDRLIEIINSPRGWLLGTRLRRS